jgi:hypothetical protein
MKSDRLHRTREDGTWNVCALHGVEKTQNKLTFTLRMPSVIILTTSKMPQPAIAKYKSTRG